jgi:hypothetical protein
MKNYAKLKMFSRTKDATHATQGMFLQGPVRLLLDGKRAVAVSGG